MLAMNENQPHIKKNPINKGFWVLVDMTAVGEFINSLSHFFNYYTIELKIFPEASLNTAEVAVENNGGFDWIPFASAALGGVAAIAASIIAFKLSNDAERKNKEREEKRIFSMHAVSGYSKLTQLVNLISNIRLHIDDSFRSAEEAGIDANEPYQAVAPSAGKFIEPEKLKVEEFIFLLKSNADIVNDIALLENRAANYLDLLNRYSSLRLDMMAWQSSIPELIREVDGVKAIDAIPIKYRDQHNSKAAQLNLLLWGIIEHLDKDESLSRKMLESYVKQARSEYEGFFPKIEVVYEEPLRKNSFNYKKYFN